jgi:1D-myo-inositol-tetrakisphosphate 5-kinase/inositol-polyphosphate multikinase
MFTILRLFSGCLQHDDGTILKPVQYPPKGQREVDFYQQVFGEQAADDKALLQLRDLVPKFHGVLHSPKESDGKLENFICIVTIKLLK